VSPRRMYPFNFLRRAGSARSPARMTPEEIDQGRRLLFVAAGDRRPSLGFRAPARDHDVSDRQPEARIARGSDQFDPDIVSGCSSEAFVMRQERCVEYFRERDIRSTTRRSAGSRNRSIEVRMWIARGSMPSPPAIQLRASLSWHNERTRGARLVFRLARPAGHPPKTRSGMNDKTNPNPKAQRSQCEGATFGMNDKPT
jgi:hypothetical protein